MSSESRLPMKAGPVPARLTTWPVDDGRHGLDASFHGATGLERARRHQSEREADGVPHSFSASEVARALSAFVY